MTVDDEAICALIDRGLWPGELPHPAPLVARPDPAVLRDAFRGALLGGAIGDALGRPAETMSRQQVLARFGRLTDFLPWAGWSSGPVGTITDDTQLTIELARCIVDGGGSVDPTDLGDRLRAWLPNGRGVGTATRRAVERLADEPWWRAGTYSAGNGGAMRAAPVGLANLGDPDRVRRQAALATIPTHAHPMAVVGAVAHAWLVGALTCTAPDDLDVDELLRGLEQVVGDLHDPGEPERDWQLRSGKTGEPVRLVDRLLEVPAWLDAPLDEALDHLYNGAFVLESLPAALLLFLRSHDDVEEVIVEAASAGRDADTVASMAGAYVGALHGAAALPGRWTGEQLEYGEELVALADSLFDLAIAPRDG